jgi:hypothetical protein
MRGEGPGWVGHLSGVLCQNLSLVLLFYVLREATSLIGTVQSICGIEDKGRAKVGIDDAPTAPGFRF